MIPPVPGKAESIQTDPGDLARVLELEMLQKRATWQRANARHRTIRGLSVLFLFIIILAAVGAFFFLFLRAKDGAANRPGASTKSEQQP
ncbi:MAG: hypothetical protein ACREIW_07835 [Chthoniobacterales bacterium]